MDPAEYPAEYPLPVGPAEYPPSIKPERLAIIRQWIPPLSRQRSSPVWFCCTVGLPSCFERTLRLGKGSFCVALGCEQATSFNPPSGFILEGAWLLLTEPMFEFSRSACRQVELDGRKLMSVEGGDCSKRSFFLFQVVFFVADSWGQPGSTGKEEASH